MREYKFRGKRIDNGDWVYGDLVRLPRDSGSWGEPPSPDMEWWIANHGVITREFVKVDPDTVGQYTELHDDEEEQNELFDGDIVELDYKGQFLRCYITFAAGGFMFVSDAFDDGYLFLSEVAEYDRSYGWVERSRKLGNKVDHPHLLEQGEKTDG